MYERHPLFFRTRRFYRRFIKDFSKITRPLTNLLAKDVPFSFDDEFLNAWEKLKMELISAPIVSAPDWSKLFEIMYDASDFATGAVLGHHIDNKQHVIYYSSKTLNEAQLNYTTTEKEFLIVVFVLKKFHLYILGTKTTIFIDHSALQSECSKRMRRTNSSIGSSSFKSLILKFEIKMVSKNVIIDHLSRVQNAPSNELPINDNFSDEQLLATFRET